MKNKKAIVLGATGLIGRSLTEQLAQTGNYASIEVWVRRSTKDWPKGVAERIVHFDTIDHLGSPCDIVFCCLGTTIKQAGSKEAFKKVDYAYPLKIAKLAKRENVSAYVIVTAMGSSSSSSIFYNKVKGEVERDLDALNFEHLGIFRPSMLLGDRGEFRLGEVIGKVFMKAFSFIIPKKYQAIQGSQVAKAMLSYSEKPQKGKVIIENQEMF